jgi:hypothetical protein
MGAHRLTFGLKPESKVQSSALRVKFRFRVYFSLGNILVQT